MVQPSEESILNSLSSIARSVKAVEVDAPAVALPSISLHQTGMP